MIVVSTTSGSSSDIVVIHKNKILKHIYYIDLVL